MYSVPDININIGCSAQSLSFLKLLGDSQPHFSFDRPILNANIFLITRSFSMTFTQCMEEVSNFIYEYLVFQSLVSNRRKKLKCRTFLDFFLNLHIYTTISPSKLCHLSKQLHVYLPSYILNPYI